MLDSSKLLFSLAEQFISQQAYQQAVKCLTPICSQSSELPSVVALARLQLASLLLEHFDNFQEAKAILLTAVGAGQRLAAAASPPPELWSPASTACRTACGSRNSLLLPAVDDCRRMSCGRCRATTS